jgi:hypothetical protein
MTRSQRRRQNASAAGARAASGQSTKGLTALTHRAANRITGSRGRHGNIAEPSWPRNRLITGRLPERGPACGGRAAEAKPAADAGPAAPPAASSVRSPQSSVRKQKPGVTKNGAARKALRYGRQTPTGNRVDSRPGGYVRGKQEVFEPLLTVPQTRAIRRSLTSLHNYASSSRAENAR